MKSMSSVDIRFCLKELQILIDGKINKIYHKGNEIRIKIYAGERYDLFIEAGIRIHLTRFAREIKLPSSFAMLLRKHLEGGRIREIKQHDFDRIVVITVERGGLTNHLIVELFAKGNIVLVNSEMNIIMALKRLRRGSTYPFPEIRINPENILEDFSSIIEDNDIVKVLAINGGLGGLYSEEICLRSGIDKNKNAKDLSNDEVQRIISSIKDTFYPVYNIDEWVVEPHIVLDNEEYIDVLPFSLEYYSDYGKKYFNTFNEALDEFYSRQVTISDKKENVELLKLEKRLEKQIEAKKVFEEESEKFKVMGDSLYENYKIVEEIMEAFRNARKNMSWDEIKSTIRERKEDIKNQGAETGLINYVEAVNPAKNSITIKIGNYIYILDLGKSIPQIADEYYEKSKKIKGKLEGLLPEIERTKERIKNVDRAVKTYSSSMRLVRKREWFEKFRWFFTSEGHLVIGGRNSQMNSEIVSKYLESNDLFFHTQSPGAPATVMKEGQNAGEASIEEAAQFSASYSALWKEGRYSGEVYFVKPDQVKKAAKAGEYLPKGSFFIEGKRNYLSVEVSCAIGIDIENLRVLGGPKSAVEKLCDFFLEIEIGEVVPNKLAIEIASELYEMAGEDEKHIVKGIATPDEIMKFLPPGTSRIKI